MSSLTPEQAKRQLWNMGNLDYLLKGNQKKIKKALLEDKNDITTILASRRFGKSYILCAWAIEECVKQKRAIVKYACPEKIMVSTIINPIINNIIEDAPDNLKPSWKEQRKVWEFPNGSEIQIAGTDKGHVEKLRGGYSQLCICDEAGFMTDLDYVVNSVMAPTTDTTNGRVILASTPNYKDPQHEFHTNFLAPLEASGNLIKFTIYESPMVDAEKIKKIIARYPGGVSNAKFRCEYLCEIAIDLEALVIPEFTPELEQLIVKETERPPYYDSYTSGDPAFVDLTGVLFGYYDFDKATIVIEEEFVTNGATMTTEALAADIKNIEANLWIDPVSRLPKPPFMRVMDNNNLILINDLHRLHNLTFVATKKDNKEAQINQVRMMLSSKRIIIDPKCKNLLYHIKNAKWDKNRKVFERLKDSPDGSLRGGHADLLDALIYLVRNVIQSKNPYPHDYNKLRGNNVHRNDSLDDSGVKGFVKQIFGRKN